MEPANRLAECQELALIDLSEPPALAGGSVARIPGLLARGVGSAGSDSSGTRHRDGRGENLRTQSRLPPPAARASTHRNDETRDP
jgi:hypothetical protein